MSILPCLLAIATIAPDAAPAALDRYGVVWNTPSANAAGSMPIGDGEVVLNVWVEAATGDLMFYIARTDALSEISRFLKLGRVRVHFDPSPFKEAQDFRQTLRLRDGILNVTTRKAGLALWVDPTDHVIHVEGQTDTASKITVSLENWRTVPRAIPKAEQGSAWSVHDAPFPLVQSADVFVPGARNVIWYHRNETSVVPRLLENQSLTGLTGTFDPILHRTFGGRISGPGFAAAGPHAISTGKPVPTFAFAIATFTAQAASVGDWLQGLNRIKISGHTIGRTVDWWHQFWNRSWVLTGDDEITRGYVLQRYVQACQGRGEYPIKFNGGYYTVEPTGMGKPFDPDFRNWGDSHWWQNVRHIYHPMLASGDLEMMEPLFRLYEKARPLAESRTKAYHNAEGAYFPETMTVFGTYSGGDYGWDRKGHQPKDVLCPWWQYAWNQGPELVSLMLDRWDYSRDEAFLKKRALPMAESVLRYFDTRFRKDAAGKIVLDPTQVVETYWEGVVNDMPTTAGLIATTQRLCALPSALVTAKQKAFFEHMKAACPDLPFETKNPPYGRPEERQLAPAQKYSPNTSNVENGELYAVWPFRIVSLQNSQFITEARNAYNNRKNHLDVGWGYDGNVAALLGITDEAARILKVKCANSNPAYRWPATWGPNFDWLPDQNHGGNLLSTTDLMLLQAEPLEAGGAIRILPAWPKIWDVDFKLHAPGNTSVHCVASAGKIQTLEVRPANRRKDVIIAAGWEISR